MDIEGWPPANKDQHRKDIEASQGSQEPMGVKSTDTSDTNKNQAVMSLGRGTPDG